MKTLFLLIVAISQAAPRSLPMDPNVRGTIRGIVKSQHSSRPVSGAQVRLSGPSLERSSHLWTATTDTGGSFSFVDVPGGRYSLAVQRGGYYSSSMTNGDPPAPLDQSTSVTVTSAMPNTQVTIALVEGGTISGLIKDAEGKPVAGVPVAALRVTYRDGRRSMTPAPIPSVKAPETNDRGEYRLFGLSPGDYFVRAEPPLTALTSSVPLRTFYPGVTHGDRAISVAVRPGQETAGIDFRLEETRSFKISGKVRLLVEGGRTLSNGSFSRAVSLFYVIPRNTNSFERITPIPNRKAADGANNADFDFELQGIPPGAYDIFPLFAGNPAEGKSAVGAYYSTRIPVDVVDRDITGLVGEIRRNPDVPTQVMLKGPPPLQPVPLTAVRVQLRPLEPLGLIASGAALTRQAAANGSIVFPNVFPARYTIDVLPLPSGYYLADIRHGNRSLYTDAILSAPIEETTRLEIVLSTGGGHVQGIVRDGRGRPAAARVVVIPKPALRSNPMLYKRAVTTAETGQFAVTNLAPGEYKIFAWEALPSGAEENAGVLARYESRGRMITIEPNRRIFDLVLDLITNY